MIAIQHSERGWQRNQVEGEPLRATFEPDQGSFEVTTEWNQVGSASRLLTFM